MFDVLGPLVVDGGNSPARMALLVLCARAGRPGGGGSRDVNTPDAAAIPDRLRDLAEQVRRLVPDWNRPERFYERRSDLAGELRRIAAEAEPGRPG